MIYYRIWADAIFRFRKHHPDKKNWKTELLLFHSWIQSLNAWILYLWLSYFEIINVQLPRIDIFPGSSIDAFLAFTIIFALPFLILNYVLIFHKNRYERLDQKYEHRRWNYAFIYSSIVIFAAFFSAVLYGLLTRS